MLDTGFRQKKSKSNIRPEIAVSGNKYFDMPVRFAKCRQYQPGYTCEGEIAHRVRQVTNFATRKSTSRTVDYRRQVSGTSR